MCQGSATTYKRAATRGFVRYFNALSTLFRSHGAWDRTFQSSHSGDLYAVHARANFCRLRCNTVEFVPYAGAQTTQAQPSDNATGIITRDAMRHTERHRTHRTGWLRAAVLGANDGIVSTASLVLGVAAAGASTQAILVAGVAGLVSGAMSMAAGEYVSVSSQADTERADLTRESKELAADPVQEHAELKGIYVARGLDATLASNVATQLMQHDALGAHARDELGISDTLAAQPVQAAMASAATFAVGAALPLLITLLLPVSKLMWGLAGSSLLFLALVGLMAARAGGAPAIASVTRVTFWGALAMALTAGVGALFGVAA